MAEPQKPVTKPTSMPKEVSAVHKLQALIENLTPEQQQELDRVGVRIPGGDLTAAIEGRYKFGVRCTQCNQIALVFVGEKWKGPHGEELTLPPTYLHHSKIAWTQNLPSEEVDRSQPRCQHCKHSVALNQDGSFRADRGRIVEIAGFARGRDSAFDKKYLADFRKRQADMASNSVAPEVSSDYTQKDVPVSKVIEQQRGPGALAELEHVAQITGVAQMVATGKVPS